MLNRLGTTTHEQTSSWWWLNGLYSVETSLSGSNGFFFGAISHLLSTIGTELRRDGATISFDRLQTLDSAFLSFLCRAKEKELLQWLFRALHYFKGFCFVLAPSVTCECPAAVIHKNSTTHCFAFVYTDKRRFNYSVDTLLEHDISAEPLREVWADLLVWILPCYFTLQSRELVVKIHGINTYRFQLPCGEFRSHARIIPTLCWGNSRHAGHFCLCVFLVVHENCWKKSETLRRVVDMSGFLLRLLLS